MRPFRNPANEAELAFICETLVRAGCDPVSPTRGKEHENPDTLVSACGKLENEGMSALAARLKALWEARC